MVPQDLKFTKEHEWVRVEGDTATMGVTEFAQGELGDVVYVELPSVGDSVVQSESMGTIEAVKAVSDFYAPLSGEILEVNDTLEATPEIVNKEPYASGWFVKIKISDIAQLDALLSPAEYDELIG